MEIRLDISGDHSPDHVVPGDLYDPAEWETFLAHHGFDIRDVYRVDINPDTTITVYQYRRSLTTGHFYLDGDSIATLDPVTLKPNLPIPVWS